MAYNADIVVRLVETEVNKAVKRIETKLNRLQDTAADVQIGGNAVKARRELQGVAKSVDALNRSFARIKPTAAFGGITAGTTALFGVMKKLAGALENIPDGGRIFGNLTDYVQELGHSLDKASGPAGQMGAAFLDLISSAPLAAGGIAAVTGGLIAFAPHIRQGISDIGNLKNAFGNLVSSMQNKGLLVFDEINEKFELTRKGMIELAKGAGSLSFLSEELREARKELNEMDRTADDFRQGTIRLIEAERNVNNELRQRKKIYDELTSAQNRIRENVEASRRSRQGSGFARFSQGFRSSKDAGTAVDRSIRRKRERQARIAAKVAGPAQTAAAPLMLPSSEMLQATERGIFRIAKKAEVFPKIAENFDRIARQGNNNVGNFVNTLKKGVEVSSGLPSIFTKANEAFAQLNKNLSVSTPQARASQAAENVANSVKLEAAKTKNIQEGNYALRGQFALYQRLLKVQVEGLKVAIENRKEAIRRLDNIRKIRAARRKQFNEDVMLGAGFPLLTGQGPGGVLGGLAGAVASQGRGGFGSQIFFSALGAQLDAFGASTIRLGQALNPLAGDIDAVVEASGSANTEYANTIQQLKELSTEQEALRHATAVLALTVGTEGVQALRQFGTDTTNLSNEFARAMARMQSAFARAFGGITQGVTAILKESSDLQTGLNLKTPEARRLQEERASILGKNTGADGKGSLIPNTPKDLQRLVAAEKRLRELGAEAVQNAKDVAAARVSQLDGQKRLNTLGLQDSKLSGLQLKNAKLKRDFTNEDFANTERAILARQRELKIEEIKEAFTDKQTGQITNYRKVAEAIARFEEQHLVKKAALETQISQAVSDAADKQKDKNDRLADENKRLAEQKDRELAQATNLTASLEYQARAAQVAGSVEARRLQIQYEHEQTVARIAQLKNQDFATSQRALADQIKQNKLANLEAETERNKAKAIYDAANPVRRIREEHEASLVANEEYNRLLMEGMLPAEAKRVSEFNKQVASLLKQVDQSILLTETAILRADADDATTNALKEQLDLLKQQKQAIEGEAAKGPGKSDTSDQKIIGDRVAQLKGELTEMTKLGNLVVKIADNIGAAFSTAFQDVINGSKSTQEALSDMLKTVGESFVQMAAEIITKQLMMIALQSILKALGGASFDAAGTGQFAEQSNKVFDGSSLFSQSPVPFKANGGPVRGGQPYMVGERGPELFVPGTSGGILRNDDMRQLMGRSPMGNTPQMNFSFETTSIGGQEFVSREQLEAAMATTRRQAANDGAKRGMNMTLDKMQNSPRTRSRVGIR